MINLSLFMSRQRRIATKTASGSIKRATVLQNIQVYQRRLNTPGLDEHSDHVIRQLLAEEEAQLVAFSRQDGGEDGPSG